MGLRWDSWREARSGWSGAYQKGVADVGLSEARNLGTLAGCSEVVLSKSWSLRPRVSPGWLLGLCRLSAGLILSW